MTFSPRARLAALSIAASVVLTAPLWSAEPAGKKPLRILYITGGCCHDYNTQKKIIPEGVSARANVEWTVFQEDSKSKNQKVRLYEKPDWSEGYDLVVHNECFGQVADREFVEKVLAAHRKGVPAVVIHCTMHTFRMLESDEWREFLGITTRRHGPQQPLDVKNLEPSNPIMKDFPPSWVTGLEELYAVEKVWPETTVLAQAYALDNKKDHAVIWTHMYGKTRVFGTTLAHNNKTMSDPVYLDMLTRGILWACDKLNDDGTAKTGYGPAKAK